MKKIKNKVKNKGFTLIEIIVTLSILVVVAIVVGISVGKVKDNKKDSEWNYLVDRIKSSANSLITSENENFIIDQEEQFLSIDELIEKGVLDKDGIKSPYDNLDVTENSNDDYHYARVFINENEAIEVEYPTQRKHYLTFNPKLSIVTVGETINLLDDNVKQCDRNNECKMVDKEFVTIHNDDVLIANISNYKFLEAGKYVIKYTYKEDRHEYFESYRVYIVRENDCQLTINNGSNVSINKTVSLELTGNNIKQYKLSENQTGGSIIDYTSSNLPTYTFTSNGNKTLYATCYYDDFLTYSNGGIASIVIKDNIPLVYTYNYTGYEQSFTVPVNATYKIEVWGAQGGSDGGHPGGNGGYASGIKTFNENEILYIYVGGKGVNQGSGGYGGWNGGGRGGYNEGGGGGGTDVRYLGKAISNRIIVGGGGGGAGYWDWWAGAGGDSSSGNNGRLFYGTSVGCPGSDGCGAGGGGGYYGGYVRSGDYGAYGGSSYVNTSYLNSASYSSGDKAGNGLVRITILDL